MISILEGKVELKTEKFAIVKTNGIGFKVFCPEKVLQNLCDNKKIRLFTYLYVKEGVLDLYGFLSYEQLELFQLLISVRGVGPKAGLGILSSASVKEIRASIASGQVALLTRVAGIGRKLAERAILELRGKILATGSDVKKLTEDNDAIEALISLGYSFSQAEEALSKVSLDIKDTEEKVKQALKVLGKYK